MIPLFGEEVPSLREVVTFVRKSLQNSGGTHETDFFAVFVDMILGVLLHCILDF